ncbi:hypothetical protein N7474_002564 [Penicillium riverlandense]|uniref:uncharacterized protein n=1 Tax=Penicillium riverlandense TaxID=1903569 RepID=UPI002549A72A|nr:uncharacterized protein N7474_002564 [Penicillium riverlandense]KAJ5825426.1 hypothetical protein N7474_002564 [Penicillium riverlandense]
MSQAALNMLPGRDRLSNSDIFLSTLTAEPPSQMLDSVNCDAIFADDPTAAGPFANYIAFLSSNQSGFHDEGGHEDQDWGIISDPAQHQYNPSLISTIDEQLQRNQFSNSDSKRGGAGDTIGGLLNLTSPSTATSDVGTISANTQPTEHGSSTRKLRRQNHSCDQCRSSKRACDLPMTVRISHKKPSTSCSTCNNRGRSCTVMWLAGKKSKSYAKKGANAVSYVAEADDTDAEKQLTDRVRHPTPGEISSVESDLSKQVDSREISLQYFNLYVDVCDMPISECLLQGSMPPQYGRGIAALAPLSASQNLAIYLKKANAWISSCWEANSESDLWSSNAAAPHAFCTVTLLDALFQGRGYKKLPHMPSSLRDASINDAYKWVAIATAAQFTIDTNRSASYSRDLAIVTWRKARAIVFKNMAATDSFRQSLSMILFGLIIRPNISPDEDNVSETDSVYALCEGIRRLDSLCAKASSHLQEMKENCPYSGGNLTWELTSDVIDNLLDLVYAIQWLVYIANDVAVVTSRGEICPMPNEPTELDFRCPQRFMGALQTPDIATSVTVHEDQDIENSILSRAMTERQTLMVLECSNISYNEVKQAVRDSAPLLILMWKALASFMLVNKTVKTGKADYKIIASRYEATMNLVALWRSSFGIFDGKSIKYLQQSPSELRRILAFCVNDGDLGVLLLYDTAQKLEKDLAERPPTPEKNILCNILHATGSSLKSQRFMSAVQISTLASICGRASSPGFEENGGLKTYVQDIGAHPNPMMVVQAQTLSARALADGVSDRVNEMDTTGASKMASKLEACLKTLRDLQNTLTTFPDVSVAA